MSPSTQIKIAIVAWCLVEAALFALLVRLFGLIPVCGFEFATGIAGFWLLKRKGRSAMMALRRRFGGRDPGARTDLVGEGLSMLGAVSLTLPGFLSDLVAICLLVPSLRTRAAALLVRKGGNWTKGGKWSKGGVFARSKAWPAPEQRQAPVIDLEPGEWRGNDIGQR